MLALLSRWVPTSLKLLLLTVAVVDDIVAIGIIAVFYSEGIAVAWLLGLATVYLGVRLV